MKEGLTFNVWNTGVRVGIYIVHFHLLTTESALHNRSHPSHSNTDSGCCPGTRGTNPPPCQGNQPTFKHWCSDEYQMQLCGSGLSPVRSINMDNDTVFSRLALCTVDLKWNLSDVYSHFSLQSLSRSDTLCAGRWCDIFASCFAGGHVDLRRLSDSLDPLRSGFRGVSFRVAGFSAHSCFCHSHVVGQVLGHVQPHYLPGGGPQTLLCQVCLF